VGSLRSISKPYLEPIELQQHVSDLSNILSQLQDEIILRFSDLIADVEQGKVSEHVLKDEIEKLLMQHKGWFNIDQIKMQLFNQLFGYGILQQHIEDQSISDIDVLKYNYALVKRNGIWERVDCTFASDREFERFCKLIIIRNGGMLNDADSHCRVSDSKFRLRINASIPPRNVFGSTLNIRKHRMSQLDLKALVGLNLLTSEQCSLIQQYNKEKRSVLICGKGGAGKTTLLSGILSNVDEMERVLICESDVEIYPQGPNMISQTIKKDYLGGISRKLSHLIQDGLTMSLDTYCVGEIIGEEAWELIQAGLTDHRILATIHASSCEDVIYRILGLIDQKSGKSTDLVIEMICRSIEIIIYVNQFKIKEIVQIQGYDHSKKRPILKEIGLW